MKRVFIMFFGLFIIGLLAACGNANENEDDTSTEEEQVVTENDSDSTEQDSETDEGSETVEDSTEPEEQTPEEDADETENNTPNEETNDSSETETDNDAVDTVTLEGTFIGLADPHTIEVETEEDTIALQILEFMDDDWESIEMGAPITIEYYQNEHGQLILTGYTL